MSTATVPALPNAHSHAFQRDLRGVAERGAEAGAGGGGPDAGSAGSAGSAGGAGGAGGGPDDFWSWRDAMFRLARTLDPPAMRAVALRAYEEMVAAGYGVVGEFHYVHHQPDGTPYDDPNAMAIAVAEAAIGARLPIVLIAAAYHRGGEPRFRDATVEGFLARVDALREWASGRDGVRIAVAAHSVRAVPAQWLEAIAAYSDAHRLVRHVHASEQPRELKECAAEHGCSPIELLTRAGFLSPHTSVVHGIHVSERDIALLAESDTIVVSCPTTEGSLGDGHLPALAYRDAGVRLALGSDSQVRIDPFEEVRELETGARRERRTRDALLAAAGGDLWGQLCTNGRASLGLDESDVGTIEIDLDHPDLRGVSERDLSLALATCASAGVVARGVAG